MKTLFNSASSPLGIPGKKLLDPGQSMLVSQKELEKLLKNRIVKAWVDNGMLETGDASGNPEKSSSETEDEDLSSQIDEGEDEEEEDEDEEEGEDSDEDDEKRQLIEKLAEVGVEKTMRTGIEKLRKLAKKHNVE